MIPKIGDEIIINPIFLEEYEKNLKRDDFTAEDREKHIVCKIYDDKNYIRIYWNNQSNGLDIKYNGTFHYPYVPFHYPYVPSEWKTQVFMSTEDVCQKCGNKLKEIVLFSSTTTICPICEK